MRIEDYDVEETMPEQDTPEGAEENLAADTDAEAQGAEATDTAEQQGEGAEGAETTPEEAEAQSERTFKDPVSEMASIFNLDENEEVGMSGIADVLLGRKDAFEE